MNSLKDVLQKFQNDWTFRQALKKAKSEEELKTILANAGMTLDSNDLAKCQKVMLGDDLDTKKNI